MYERVYCATVLYCHPSTHLLLFANQYTGSEDAQDKPNGSSSTPRSSSSNAFCRFIKHYLTNRFGLKKLVDQQAWELIDGLNSLQHVRKHCGTCFLVMLN
jgi:hypothetical protein